MSSGTPTILDALLIQKISKSLGVCEWQTHHGIESLQVVQENASLVEEWFNFESHIDSEVASSGLAPAKKVQEEQFKTLKKHQERLAFWIDELQKSSLEQGMKENAIFEIAKMPEEEIFHQ